MTGTYEVAIEILEWYRLRVNLSPKVTGRYRYECPICASTWHPDEDENHFEFCWIPKLEQAQRAEWGER